MIPGIGIGVGYYPESYGGGWNPYVLANLAARYDLSNTSSYITATGVKLLGDLSGNSNVNVLALNGVSGQYGSTPDSPPLQLTTLLGIRAKVTLNSWAPATNQMIVSKCSNSGQFSYQLFVDTAGKLHLSGSANGTTFALDALSSAATGFLAYSTNWVWVTRRSSDGNTKFYTSPDGITWTQLGTTVGSTAGNYFVGTDALQIGANVNGTSNVVSGTISEVSLYAEYDTANAPVFDANFATAPKLASTFTESSTNAATVTINTSGDHGARICGARDQVEMTAARQPTVSGNTLSFSSAASQHMDCAKFAFGQPNTIFLVGSLTTWASGTYMLDGDTANTMGLVCTTGTPKMSMNAGSNAAENSNLTVGQRSIFMLQFNGASSSFQINATTATTGNPGAGSPNGITIGALASVVNFADMNMNELIAYTGAMDGATIAQVRAYLAAKWSVTL